MCDLYAMVGSMCGGASIFTMVAIALDRYNVIVKVKIKKNKIKKIQSNRFLLT